MTKKRLINKIKKLPWGSIMYGYQQNGDVININDYDDDTDMFYGYDKNLSIIQVKFDDLPKDMFQN